MSVLVCCLNSSSATCNGEPDPAEAEDTAPGDLRTSARNSCTSLAGNEGCTARTTGIRRHRPQAADEAEVLAGVVAEAGVHRRVEGQRARVRRAHRVAVRRRARDEG